MTGDATAAAAIHFLDEVPYRMSRPEARELRNLLSTSIHGSAELVEVLRATDVPLDLVALDKPARYVWSDVLVLASKRNPKGGARAFVEKLAASASELGLDFLKERLDAYLAAAPPPVTSAAVIAPPAARVLEAVLGMRSAFVDPVTLPAIVAAARSVVRIAASFAEGAKYGTGFLIGARRVLTNHHVLYAGGVPASSLTVWFDYEPDAAGGVPAPVVVAADAASIRGEKKDDVGVFDLTADPPDRKPLVFADASVLAEAKVAIVQHPQGLPKQVAFHTVIDEKDGLVHYLTDTEAGSSGSPVLNRLGQVVALHHASTDVKIKGGQVPVNEGISAARVRAALKALAAGVGT